LVNNASPEQKRLALFPILFQFRLT
jgi:hypothetical protein